MSKLWKKGPKGQPQEVRDLASLRIDSPTIIFLPGHLARDYTPEIVQTSFESFDKLLRETRAPKAHVYVWTYTHRQQPDDLLKYRFFPNHAKRPSAEVFAEGIIRPLVSDHNGQRLPLDEARAHLRNITLVGHSAGSIFSEEIFNAAYKEMRKLDYSEEETRNILDEIVNISLGTVAKAVTKEERFTSVYFAHTDDLYINIKNKLFHPLKSTFLRHARPLKIRQVTDTSLLITDAAAGRWRDRNHDAQEEDIDIVLPRWNLSHTNHGFYNYVTDDPSTSQIAHMVASVLFNAVNRKEDFTVSELLAPAPALPAKDKAIYQQRMALAMAGAL